MLLKKALLFLMSWMVLLAINAQTDSLKYDTSYYRKYTDQLIITPFLAKTASAFSLNTPDAPAPIRYFINKPMVFGLRLGYDFLSLAGSFGLGAIDPDYDKSKGKTQSINLQTTFNARKLLVDVYFQSYKGLYVRGNPNSAFNDQHTYVRPDIRSNLFGITGQYVFNGNRFSTRPPFKYDARQLKTAGSFLAGAEILYGTVKGDSALIPTALASQFPQSNIGRVKYLTFGPSIGYGHTFLIDQNFYATLVASINGDISQITEYNLNHQEIKKWRIDPNFNARMGFGYNTDRWQLGISYLTNRMFFTGNNKDAKYFANNNFYRLDYTQRIHAGKTIPKVVHWVGQIIESLGLGFLIH